MRHFHNILYVNFGAKDEWEGLKQAVDLARNNRAPLKILVVSPEFPPAMSSYKNAFEAFLMEKTDEVVKSTLEAASVEASEMDVTVALESTSNPAISIIQHVLRNGHDLLVKEPELREGMDGFNAVDMKLLRKCPCPVWFCRPKGISSERMKVAVAIDPECSESSARILSLRMLELSSSLAHSCGGVLDIISCWKLEFEKALRHSPRLKIPSNQLDESLRQKETNHMGALVSMISESKIDDNYHIHHLKGNPNQMIPAFVNENKIDILVMGTLARTGIPGLVMGNTAENIVQTLHCSLLALKPNGFVSPVKAF